VFLFRLDDKDSLIATLFVERKKKDVAIAPVAFSRLGHKGASNRRATVLRAQDLNNKIPH
jgi:hypothetical protein